jgi:hypothetical protein
LIFDILLVIDRVILHLSCIGFKNSTIHILCYNKDIKAPVINKFFLAKGHEIKSKMYRDMESFITGIKEVSPLDTCILNDDYETDHELANILYINSL